MISPVMAVIECEDIIEKVPGLHVFIGAARLQHAACALWIDWLTVSTGSKAWASAYACAGCAWVHPPAPTSQSVS